MDKRGTHVRPSGVNLLKLFCSVERKIFKAEHFSEMSQFLFL